MKYPQIKYSKTKVNWAGKILSGYIDPYTPKISNDVFREAFEILNNWRSCHSYPINTFQATLRNKLKIVDPKAFVAQRLKRFPSIVFKLDRYPKMNLARMQDIGGLRAVVTSLKKVRQLENNYKVSRFKHKFHSSKDYINRPKSSGYRSVHLVYKYNNPRVPEYNGLFIELQIRTKQQHAWATAVETMGTYLQYSLKSSEGPNRWLNFFSLVGSAFAHMEGTEPVPGYENLSEINTYKRVLKEAKSLDIKNKLLAYTVATRHVVTNKKKGSYHLVTLNLKKKTVRVATYTKNQLDQANKDYLNIEREVAKNKPIQAVLVSTGSIKNLRQAYPNYFLDTRQFVKIVDSIEKISLAMDKR